MGTARSEASAVHFVCRLIAWSLGLFGLLQLPWVGTHILLPATRLEAAAGSAIVGPSSHPIDATLACSASDALALCLGAVLAYPARWRMRAAGVTGGTAIILAMNTIRISSLGREAAAPRFHILHVYVWPALLTIAIACFVFSWMRIVDRGQARDSVSTHPAPRSQNRREARRFVLAAISLLVCFTLASPLYLASAQVLTAAAGVARTAAFLLRILGVNATATASVLATPAGAYLVTQECIATPLIPVYFAAVLVYSSSWQRGALLAIGAAPLFLGLGVARLLVVAVPGTSGDPSFFIHAFSQLLIATGMVAGVAFWRRGAHAATFAWTAAALMLAVAFVRLLGAPYTHAILRLRFGVTPVDDPQGALMFLPAFQFGLFLALWVAGFFGSGWMRFISAAAFLVTTQIALTGGVEMLAHFGVAPLVRDVRAWSLLGPVVIIAMMVKRESLRG